MIKNIYYFRISHYLFEMQFFGIDHWFHCSNIKSNACCTSSEFLNFYYLYIFFTWVQGPLMNCCNNHVHTFVVIVNVVVVAVIAVVVWVWKTSPIYKLSDYMIRKDIIIALKYTCLNAGRFGQEFPKFTYEFVTNIE